MGVRPTGSNQPVLDKDQDMQLIAFAVPFKILPCTSFAENFPNKQQRNARLLLLDSILELIASVNYSLHLFALHPLKTTLIGHNVGRGRTYRYMKSLRYPRLLVAVWDMCWWPRRQLMEVRHNQVSLAALYTSNVLVDRGHQKGPTLSHCKTQTKPSLVGISQCVIKRRCKKTLHLRSSWSWGFLIILHRKAMDQRYPLAH